MKPSRRLKIYTKYRSRRWGSTTVPQIKLEGLWLEQLGFKKGQEVDVEQTPDKITITVRQP
jgi:toxic protein SymE